MLLASGSTDSERLRFGFRLVTARTPAAAELTILEDTLAAGRTHYAQDPEAARKVISVGESAVPEDVPAPELAAYTIVANLLLNLDEALTKN